MFILECRGESRSRRDRVGETHNLCGTPREQVQGGAGGQSFFIQHFTALGLPLPYEGHYCALSCYGSDQCHDTVVFRAFSSATPDVVFLCTEGMATVMVGS